MSCCMLGRNTTIGLKASPLFDEKHGWKPIAFSKAGLTVKDWLFYHFNWLGLDFCLGRRQRKAVNT